MICNTCCVHLSTGQVPSTSTIITYIPIWWSSLGYHSKIIIMCPNLHTKLVCSIYHGTPLLLVLVSIENPPNPFIWKMVLLLPSTSCHGTLLLLGSLLRLALTSAITGFTDRLMVGGYYSVTAIQGLDT